MSKISKTRTLIDIAVIVALPLLAATLSWILPLNFLESILLFFGLPGIYISWRKPALIRRSLTFALPLSLIALLGDYLAATDKSWFVPTVFHFRILGYVAVENVIWFFLASYLIVSYYQLFYDHVSHKTIGRRMPYLYLVLVSVILFLGLFILISESDYRSSYFYLKSGLVLAVLPILAFVIEFPKFVSIFLRITPYFVALFFLNEIVGLHNGYWTFPGDHFLGWVQIIGYRFPYEELVLYIALFSSVIITYFEIFDDNYLMRFKHRFSLTH